MTWQTFPHQADIGVRGSGATLPEAFSAAARALTSVICDPATVAADQFVSIECSAPDAELLFLDWLNALIYEMSTRHMLFSEFDVRIDGRHLQATAWGEPIDVTRHRPASEVKGASFCELAVGRGTDGRWLAQCVVDV